MRTTELQPTVIAVARYLSAAALRSPQLVTHPQGHLLMDTGFGRNIPEQIATLPLMLRM